VTEDEEKYANPNPYVCTDKATSPVSSGSHSIRFLLQNAPKPPFTLPDCESWSGGWNMVLCFKNCVHLLTERYQEYGADCAQRNHWV